ncbi:MAG: TauD/TfdA family dioxygenase [Pseudomonadota bacterium]
MTRDISTLPAPLEGPAVWYGPEVASSAAWRFSFSDAELEELQQAAQVCLDTLPDISAMRQAHFVLPTLAPRLQEIHRFLIEGPGFALVRALPVRDWPLEVSAAVFFGLGCHLGNPRPQNARGHVLGHVVDLGLSADDPNVRIYQTHERQTFHTDSCDIVGLLCLQEAVDGGDSALVSANTIYNELVRQAPRLAAALMDPVATDRRGEFAAGEKPFFEIPVFNWHEGRMSSIYQRQYIDSAQRFPEAMRLTPLHVEALDAFDLLANDPRLNFMMRLAPGDMQFVHNHTLLHDRTAFRDHADPAQRRHLLRLWLSSPAARPLPDVFAQRFGSVVPGERGGVSVPPERWHAPLAP